MRLTLEEHCQNIDDAREMLAEAWTQLTSTQEYNKSEPDRFDGIPDDTVRDVKCVLKELANGVEGDIALAETFLGMYRKQWEAA